MSVDRKLVGGAPFLGKHFPLSRHGGHTVSSTFPEKYNSRKEKKIIKVAKLGVDKLTETQMLNIGEAAKC